MKALTNYVRYYKPFNFFSVFLWGGKTRRRRWSARRYCVIQRYYVRVYARNSLANLFIEDRSRLIGFRFVDDVFFFFCSFLFQILRPSASVGYLVLDFQLPKVFRCRSSATSIRIRRLVLCGRKVSGKIQLLLTLFTNGVGRNVFCSNRERVKNFDEFWNFESTISFWRIFENNISYFFRFLRNI